MVEAEVRGKALAPKGIFGDTDVGSVDPTSGAGALPNGPQSETIPQCPNCGPKATKVYRDGLRILADGSQQHNAGSANVVVCVSLRKC